MSNQITSWFKTLTRQSKIKLLPPALAVILSLPLLMGATPKPAFTISGVQGKVLKNIRLRLTEFNQTKPLAQESDETLRKQIEEALEPFGYFEAQIILNRQPLRVTINPGSQMLISKLNLSLLGEGANNPKIKKALTKLPIAQGEPFNSAKYEQAKQNLMTVAEGQGYLHSFFDKAEILIDKKSNRANISLDFNTGSRYYFGQVQFDPTYISPELLHRFLPFSPGQPYSTDKVLAFNNYLANSGYFQNITVKPQMSSSLETIPIDVHFQPVSRKSYSLGLGFGTDTKVRGRAGYHVSPVNPAGHKFNLIGIGSFKQSSLQSQYIIPGANPVTDEFHLSASGSYLNYTAGSSTSALFSIGQHYSIPTYQRFLSINGLFDGYHYKNLPDQPNENSFTFFPKASFNWLKRKDKLFTPTGYNLSLTSLGSTTYLGSHENFFQTSVNAKAALTVKPIRTRFFFHTIQGITQINKIQNLPLSLALLLGGADNLKAYSFNSIGPGKILTYAGLEVQKETKKHWYLIGFFDSGDVYNPSSKQLKHDAGIGLMWVSPIGPIKLGVAQRLDNHFHRDGKIPKFFFSMGSDL